MTLPILPARVVGAPASGAVTVDVGGKQMVAAVPTSVLGVADGQMVRVEVDGLHATVREITAGLTVSAAPSDAATDADTSVPINTTTSSGAYDGYYTDDAQAATYAQDIAAYTRGLASDINELRDDVDDLATAYEALATKYNALAGKFNSLIDALQAVGVIT